MDKEFASDSERSKQIAYQIDRFKGFGFYLVEHFGYWAIMRLPRAGVLLRNRRVPPLNPFGKPSLDVTALSVHLWVDEYGDWHIKKEGFE